MAWPSTVTLEIQAEFRRLAGSPYDAFVERVYQVLRWRRTNAREYFRWWARTRPGRARAKRSNARRYARDRATTVAVRGCAICKRPFRVTADQARRGRGLVCSPECRVFTRKNVRSFTIGERTMPLAAWCERIGVKYATAAYRIRRGWPVERALGLEERSPKACST